MAEETGLAAETDRIVYIQEFVEPDFHFCKFFILCGEYSGNLKMDHKPDGEEHLVDVRCLSSAEIKELEVYPEVLYDKFWNDWKGGFPKTRYMGLRHVDP